MKASIKLTEEEQSVFEFDFGETLSSDSVGHNVLYTRIMTSKKVWLSALQRQMAEHWDGRFPVKISEVDDMFMLTLVVKGTNKEFWRKSHSIFRTIMLHFMSKTKRLAVALGNLIGEFINVFEDSLFEGWGPFLRIRVKIDVTKPLLRGRMITLLQVRDKFGVKFRYERLPEYCMECGRMGHPYNKCTTFLEKLDRGEELELEYRPTIKGSPLPTSGYDRYRTDFGKGNAWPLLTRLARTSLTAAVPSLIGCPQPHPTLLHHGESSHQRHNVPGVMQHSVTFPSASTAITIPITTPMISVPATSTMPSPSNNFSTKSQASHFGLSHDNKQNFTHNSGMPPTAPFIAVVPSGSLSLAPATFTIHTSTPEFTSAPQTKPVTHAQFDVNNTSLTSKLGSYNDLSGIYTPPIGPHYDQNIVATYPPHPHTASCNNTSILHASTTNSLASPSTIVSTKAAIMGKENCSPNQSFKRQHDRNSMRETLKRCRGLPQPRFTPSLSAGDDQNQQVSNADMDSSGSLDIKAVVDSQPRNQP
uniref:Zinc knuckle CX2CX4HX4C domain-containing protein n=1 Tax=Cannabis sativa TaxID=3483 RepID=A0A803PLP6_CANSA